MVDHSLMAKQKAARLKRQAETDAHAAELLARTSSQNFWDNIDESNGVDSCHMWTGERKWNHHDGDKHKTRFEQGVFRYEGCTSWIATRVLAFALFGREVPKDQDVTPICGEHLCCNRRHLAITPHGGHGDGRTNRAIPFDEYFCAEVRIAPAA